MASSEQLFSVFDDIEKSFSRSFNTTFSAIIDDVNESLNVVLASVKSRAKHFEEKTMRDLATLRSDKQNEIDMTEAMNLTAQMEEQLSGEYERELLNDSYAGLNEQFEIRSKNSIYEPSQVVQDRVKPSRYKHPQVIQSRQPKAKSETERAKDVEQEAKITEQEVENAEEELKKSEQELKIQNGTRERIYPDVNATISVNPENRSTPYVSYSSTSRNSKGSTTLMECPQCGKVFSSKLGLERHLKDIHPTGQATFYQCDKCDFYTKNKLGLTYHNNSKHTGRETYRNRFGTFPA